MRDVPETHPLHRLFRGLTESTFLGELGIGDPKLVGYVAGLLARFVPAGSLSRLRDRQGRRLVELAAMVAEAESCGDDDRRRECHRQVGDVALFWTGVYPEALPSLRKATNVDHLVDFQAQGKRSYYLASTIESDEAAVFRRLSAEFELCAFGLSLVRQEWERHDGPPEGQGPPLILA